MMLFPDIEKRRDPLFDESYDFRIDLADKRTFQIIYRFEFLSRFGEHLSIRSMGGEDHDGFIISYFIDSLYENHALFLEIFGDFWIMHECMNVKNLLILMICDNIVKLIYGSFHAETETWRSEIIYDFCHTYIKTLKNLEDWKICKLICSWTKSFNFNNILIF